MIRFIVPLLIIVLFSSSCFEKDKPMPPLEVEGQTFAFEQSIYTHQCFFSLGSNSIVRSNRNEDWDLCFESSPAGWHIRVNSSNYMNIYHTGIVDFSATQFAINEKQWRYDKSDGDPDSTAIGTWVDTSVQPHAYSRQVYLIGNYDGTQYKPLKKMVFTAVNDTSYKFTYADLNGDNTTNAILIKDTTCNFTYFSLTGGQVTIEPPRKEWDMLFTQYVTTLYDMGNPVQYYVRGVLLNPYKVHAAVDSAKVFDNISIADLPDFSLGTDWDIIGHNWKSVQIDVQGNSARYFVRPGYNYIIGDVKGDYYKLKFVSFYNKTGAVGYPAFDFVKLSIDL